MRVIFRKGEKLIRTQHIILHQEFDEFLITPICLFFIHIIVLDNTCLRDLKTGLQTFSLYNTFLSLQVVHYFNFLHADMIFVLK